MKAHGIISDNPITDWTNVRAICGAKIAFCVAIPLETSEIPVGQKLTLPDWICPKCKKVGVKAAKGRQWLYAITPRGREMTWAKS